MRIVKQRLKEMIPDLEVFLDVDECAIQIKPRTAALLPSLPKRIGCCCYERSLEEIGDLEGYIERTTTILVYCSSGYFQSKNCMRELVASTRMRKPIIALIDPDASRGGLSLDEVHARLLTAEGSYAKWGFDEAATPNGQALHDHLFASEAIEWNRACRHNTPRPHTARCGELT